MSQEPTAFGLAEFSLLEAWVAENPGSRLFLRLARAYLQAGRLDQAARTLERGLLLHPADVEGRELLAQVLENRGDQAGALAQLGAAAAELGRHAGVYERLAGLLASQGWQAEAEVARRLAGDLAFAFGDALGQAAGPGQARTVPGQDTPTLAEIYAAQGLNEKAARIYRDLLGQEPGNQLYRRRLIELDPLGAVQDRDQDVLARLEALRGAALARMALV